MITTNEIIELRDIVRGSMEALIEQGLDGQSAWDCHNALTFLHYAEPFVFHGGVAALETATGPAYEDQRERYQGLVSLYNNDSENLAPFAGLIGIVKE